VPIFSKLVNYRPHISALLENIREGIQDIQILWAKVQKQKSYEAIKFWTLVPIFLKLLNFGPHISELLESAKEGLHGSQILWAKAQKRQSYRVINFW